MATATWEISGMTTRPGRRPSADPVVVERLEQWGRDVGQRSTPGDWPAMTLLSRLIEYGPMGASQAGAPAPLGDPKIAETERAVAQLPPRYKRAIVAFYAQSIRGNTTLCARHCHCSIRQLQDTLKHARLMISDALARKN
jgi:hypothetical protein